LRQSPEFLNQRSWSNNLYRHARVSVCQSLGGLVLFPHRQVGGLAPVTSGRRNPTPMVRPSASVSRTITRDNIISRVF
jgi:hypothetical protein